MWHAHKVPSEARRDRRSDDEDRGIACVKKANMREFWCIASSRSDFKTAELLALYAKRFTTEENFRDTKDTQVRFANIHAEKASFTVRELCETLDVSTSGDDAWAKRRPGRSNRIAYSVRQREAVREAFLRSQSRYGSPRVHAELTGC